MLIGRKPEILEFNDVFNSRRAEFVAIYGRRRIGKTYLVEQVFEGKETVFFHVTGIQKGPMKEQLSEFAKSVGRAFFSGASIKPSLTWLEAFEELNKAIEQESSGRNIIIFMDEFPWLCTRKSRLLQALDYYWNHYWRKDKRIKLVVCGSSASWMIKKIINDKGGLHNRCTRQILLKPFTLSETKSFFEASNLQFMTAQLLDIYMFCGGVPFYLDNIRKGQSVPQQIDRMCFTHSGLLYNEFDKLFESLFEDADSYKLIIRIIASRREGISQTELLSNNGLISAGGRIVDKLKSLEAAAFIKSFIPIHNKRQGIYYRVIDEYCHFYLEWIEPVKKHLTFEDDENLYWSSKINTPAYYTWRGYAFESICYKHIGQIRRALSIPAGSQIGVWRYTPRSKAEKGAQIDMVFVRKDGVTNLVEIKCTDKAFCIDKAYYENLMRKKEIYKAVTRSQNQLNICMVSANGVHENPYSELILDQYISLDAMLF